MVQKLETDIVLNLAGNLAAKARQYGNSMGEFAKRNEKAMTLVKTSTAAAGRGIDSLGNRYVGLATTLATGATVRNVAAFEAQMTRIGTNAKLTSEQVDLLSSSVEDLSVQSDIRIDSNQLASGVDTLLEKTGDFEFVISNLENMGLFMQAFGADADSTARLFAQFRAKGVRDSQEVMNSIDDLYSQFSIGSVNVKDLASISEQLFTVYGGKGPEAIRQMGALVQMFAKTRGSASEALTSLQGVFSVFDDPKKIQFLEREGVQVFKEGTQDLREPTELLLDILEAAGDSSSKLKDVFTDAVSVQGLKALFDPENKDLVREMVKATDDLGATQKASATNAATFNSAVVALNNSYKKFANERLSEPVRQLADAINSVDDDTIQSWLKWGEAAVWAVGALVAGKKSIDAVNAVGRFLGKGKGGTSGNGRFQDLGAMPVFVVNMPASGLGGTSGVGSSSKPTKGRNGFKTGAMTTASAVSKAAVPAYIAYEASSLGASIVDATLDSLFDGYRDADRKFTTKVKAYFGDKEAQQQAIQYYGVDPKSYERGPTQPSSYLTGNYAPVGGQSNYPIGGNLQVSVGVTDDRIHTKVSTTNPSIQIDPDTGTN